jgi:hypothetical protein
LGTPLLNNINLDTTRGMKILFAVFMFTSIIPFNFSLCDYLNLFNSDLDKEFIEALCEALDIPGRKDVTILAIS